MSDTIDAKVSEPLTSTPFVDWPPRSRMMARNMLEGAGAGQFSYDPDGSLIVAVEVGCQDRVELIANRLGMVVVNRTQFPLGSDKPPESFRHVSWTYGGPEPSCWLHWRLMPRRIAK